MLQSPHLKSQKSIRSLVAIMVMVILPALMGASVSAAPIIPIWQEPALGAHVIVDTEIQLVAETPSGSGGTAAVNVDFFADGLPLGAAVETSSGEWQLTWRPRIIGEFQLTARSTDAEGAVSWSEARSIAVGVNTATGTAFYAGGTGIQEMFDVNELSDGTLLISGSVSDLDWIPAGTPLTLLAAPELIDQGTGRYGVLVHLSADLETVLHVSHLPLGHVHQIRWIRSTNRMGEPTAMVYVSGETNTGYFIGRLDSNFVDGSPTGFDWTYQVLAANGHEKDQSWDVGNDGRVVFAAGGQHNAQIGFLNPAGERMSLPALRASHWVNGEFVRGIGSAFAGVEYSAIRLPTDNQSWDDAELFAITADGNGGIRQGTWPIDIMIRHSFETGEPIRFIDGRAYGYNGYRPEGRHWIGAVTVDRRNNHFYYGFNIKSILAPANGFGENPDFEPAVIGYDAAGNMKWWNRLYTEAADTTGDGLIDTTWRSEPDQYIDGLHVDYSVPLSEGGNVIVAARSHGNNASNLWSGNQIAANPAASGFQNRITGTEGNIHLTWIGRLKGQDGTLLNASWVSGYFRNVPQTQMTYPESIHDGWPSHNDGWFNLTSTWMTKGALRVGLDGRVYLVGIGPRMVTTYNAFQKLPRQTGSVFEGHSPWSAYVRVFEPDLSKLAYSSALTGIWTRDAGFTANGASNVQLNGIYPTNNGVFIVGNSQVNSDGTPSGNPMPVSNVPTWANASPTGISGVLGHFLFSGGPNVPPDVALVSPNFGTVVEPGTEFEIEAIATDYDGTIASVEFFVNGVLTHTSFAAPHLLSWTAPDSDGTYNFSARAMDDQGTSSDATTRTVSVFTPNRPPVVAIVSPVAGGIVPRGTTVNIIIDASDPSGSVSSVEVFANGVSIELLSSEPWTFSWSPPAGEYTLVAQATDNENAVSESPPVQLIVGGPPVAQQIALNFHGSATDLDQTATGGYYWNSTSGATFSTAPLRTLDGGAITNITASTASNPFGFLNTGRGAALEVAQGPYVFPFEVTRSYLADNLASGRNGHASVRFFSPTPVSYSFTILSSYAHGNPGDNAFVSGFNVGGSYSQTTRTFTGGETLILDSSLGAGNWSAGEMGPFEATATDGGYELILTAGQITGGVYLNGMIVELIPTVQNLPPIAMAAEVEPIHAYGDIGIATVSLDGSASYDPDEGDSIFAYRWYLGDVLLGTGATPEVELPEGTHVVELVVLDEFFESNSTSISVTVLPTPGIAPVAVPASSSPGQDLNNDGFAVLTLDGSASYDPDAGDTVISHRWFLGETLLAEGVSAEIMLPVGFHTLILEVVDTRGKSNSVDFMVEVLASPGVPPVAVVPNDFSIENSDDSGSMHVALDGSASFDPDGDYIVSYEWYLEGEPFASGVTINPILALGSHVFTLVVTDTWNMSGSADVTVTVIRPPLVAPVANAGPAITVRDLNNNGFEPVQLDASASYDPLGPIGIVSYKWKLNGVLVATGRFPIVTFPVGTHTINLTVRDDDGLEDTDTLTITVLPALEGPVSRIAIAMGNADFDERGLPGGVFWNGVMLTTTELPLLDVDGEQTDVQLEFTKPFTFDSANRGASIRLEVDGISIPPSVVQSYMAASFGSGGTGHAVLRLTSQRDYRIRLTAVSSMAFQDPSDGFYLSEINTGGVWGGSSNRRFIGGDSIFLDGGKGPLNYDTATSTGWLPEPVGSGYSLNIEFGALNTNNSAGVRINALILELTDLTEVAGPGYSDWIANYADIPADRRGALDDASGDGISNLLAYARGLDPRQVLVGAVREAIKINHTDDGLVVTLLIPEDLNLPDLRYRVLHSTDLAYWSPIAEAVGSADFVQIGSSVTSINRDSDRINLLLPATSGYVMLEVTLIP